MPIPYYKSTLPYIRLMHFSTIDLDAGLDSV